MTLHYEDGVVIDINGSRRRIRDGRGGRMGLWHSDNSSGSNSSGNRCSSSNTRSLPHVFTGRAFHLRNAIMYECSKEIKC